MTIFVALLALVVAIQYVVIAADIVPRFARLAAVPERAITLAKWGAMAFFAGCAVTHLQIAHHMLTGGGGGASAAHLAADHIVPHVAQIVGGVAFISIAKRRLEIRLTTKDTAGHLRDVERRFRATFERSPTGIALLSLGFGRGGQFLQVNPALGRMVGLSPDVLLHERHYEDLVHPGDRERDDVELRAMLAGERNDVELEQRYRHSDGSDVWVQVRASLVRDDDGEPLFNLVQMRDITDERTYSDKLRFLADHDALTGLFNRRRFEEEVDGAVVFARRFQLPASLFVIDLDQFKHVNDGYGHLAGDDLLRTVANVLSARLRDTDIVGRLGGDEFGVICPHTSPAVGELVGRDLLEAIRADAQLHVAERTVRITASIGGKQISGDELATGAELLAEADNAMYEAKEGGRDRLSMVDFAAAAPTQMRARLTWAERIRDGLDGDGFVLWEQPILNLATGICDRSELLIRMVDADGRPVLPGVFLPVAERFGQIQAIDRWVLRLAVELARVRQAAGNHDVLEVNLSGISLTDESLIDDLVSQIKAASIDPTRLIFEVTETAAVANFDDARRFAGRITDLGCQFALDDFGSGFGSFYYLKHLPFDGVKIDGDFVKDLAATKADQLTVQAIVQICAGLGKETTAEFVQNDATIDLLTSYGVDFAQGYHIGKPRPVTAVAEASVFRSPVSMPSPVMARFSAEGPSTSA